MTRTRWRKGRGRYNSFFPHLIRPLVFLAPRRNSRGHDGSQPARSGGLLAAAGPRRHGREGRAAARRSVRDSSAPRGTRACTQDVTVHRLDLKEEAGRLAMDALLLEADLLVTAQRPSALARLGLGAQALAERFPRLCHVAMTGHAPPHEEVPGHDLTYLAQAGILSPPALPPTLYADMAGAERAGHDGARPGDRARPPPARALRVRPALGGRGLAGVAAAPTASPRPAACSAAAHPGYNVYAAKRDGSRSPRSSRISSRPSARRCSSAAFRRGARAPASPPRTPDTGRRGRGRATCRSSPFALLSPPES